MACLDDAKRFKMEIAEQIARGGNQGRPHIEINADGSNYMMIDYTAG